MAKSIRRRLLIWHGLLLILVIGGFAVVLDARIRESRFRAFDERLRAGLQYLDAELRSLPLFELRNELPKKFPPKERPQSRSGKSPLEELGLPETTTDDPQGTYFLVRRYDGSILKASPNVPESVDPSALTESKQILIREGEGHREFLRLGPERTIILVGQSTHRLEADLNGLRRQLVGIALIALGIGLAGSWWVATRTVRPLARIASTAASISATHLSERIETPQLDTELIHLGMILNDMFARLEVEFERQRQFTADASHELRTPLTIMHAQVDLALSRLRTPEEYQTTLEVCRAATTRMRLLIDGLLTLARADAGQLGLSRTPIQLPGFLEEAADLHREAAETAGIELQVKASEQVSRVVGDPVFLGRILGNLLSNAIRHTPSGGTIILSCDSDENSVLITVEDTGEGIPEDQRSKVFERFFRADQSRSRDTGGMGLGLAICKSIVEAHEGSISYRPQKSGGSIFEIRLPRT